MIYMLTGSLKMLRNLTDKLELPFRPRAHRKFLASIPEASAETVLQAHQPIALRVEPRHIYFTMQLAHLLVLLLAAPFIASAGMVPPMDRRQACGTTTLTLPPITLTLPPSTTTLTMPPSTITSVKTSIINTEHVITVTKTVSKKCRGS